LIKATIIYSPGIGDLMEAGLVFLLEMERPPIGFFHFQNAEWQILFLI
jgi:hypothetical protein